MRTDIDETENLARMMRGEFYYPLTPQLNAARDRCNNAVRRFNSFGGGLTRRQMAESWKEITQSSDPLPPPGSTEAEEYRILSAYPWIDGPIHIDYGTNIRIGSGTYINCNAVFIDTCLVTIGSRVLIGPNVSFFSGTHPLDPDLRDGLNGPASGGTITIGDDCWVAGNVVFLPGITVGDGCTIGAGSVVNKVPFLSN
ncbi:trimeric LpxA-like protein [Xylogone sp. PMI_703]|nr:trimeric LpxA-like protein [Xylogone sp. PMI_703]